MAMIWGMAQNRNTHLCRRCAMYSKEWTACWSASVTMWFRHATALSRRSGAWKSSSSCAYFPQISFGQNIRGAGSSVMSSR